VAREADTAGGGLRSRGGRAEPFTETGRAGHRTSQSRSLLCVSLRRRPLFQTNTRAAIGLGAQHRLGFASSMATKRIAANVGTDAFAAATQCRRRAEDAFASASRTRRMVRL
jgi:hypothetical protein